MTSHCHDIPMTATTTTIAAAAIGCRSNKTNLWFQTRTKDDLQYHGACFLSGKVGSSFVIFEELCCFHFGFEFSTFWISVIFAHILILGGLIKESTWFFKNQVSNISHVSNTDVSPMVLGHWNSIEFMLSRPEINPWMSLSLYVVCFLPLWAGVLWAPALTAHTPKFWFHMCSCSYALSYLAKYYCTLLCRRLLQIQKLYHLENVFKLLWLLNHGFYKLGTAQNSYTVHGLKNQP